MESTRVDLGSGAARHGGSSPSTRTKLLISMLRWEYDTSSHAPETKSTEYLQAICKLGIFIYTKSLPAYPQAHTHYPVRFCTT